MGCVFVIDDDDNLRRIITAGLRGFGFEVRDFGNLDDALGTFDAVRPNVAIVDLKMPGSKIQDYLASFSSENCSVIVYSGHIDDDAHLELLKRGVMWILCKPLSSLVLAEYVRKAERASTNMRVMRKLQPAGKELKERLQRSSDALAEFTTRLKNEPTAQTT